ncbi:HEAT repeat domain-containing protein [Streptomyces sp. NPDC051130]|uniref:HEAT repeat domain-containing protein n=1 Tax=Streptomyces sp. NPDC051130 TaxID=3157223 RepID=UPI00342A4B95
MWDGLSTVDWAALEHNYGSAADVPDVLRRCAGPDVGDAEEASSELFNLLFHQGGWICSAATAALPFLLDLASQAQVPSRREVLELVSMLAAEAGQVADRFLDPGWRPTWEDALPKLLALLSDPEPAVRCATADVIGSCESPGALVLPALVHAWEREDHPATRLELILAIGQAAIREPVGADAAAALNAVRRLLGSSSPQLRLAALHALATNEPDLPAQLLDVMLSALRHPSVEIWQRTSSIRAGVQGVIQWTSSLLPGPSPDLTLGLLADHRDDEQRIAGLAQAGGLLARWHSPTTVLLPAISGRLGDSSAEVRFRAAELLACLGPTVASQLPVAADEVAALLDDTGARTSRRGETVAEAALWALARMGDPRCVPGLIALVSGDRSGLSSPSIHSPAHDWHFPALPSLQQVLLSLPDLAEPMLQAVRDRIDTARDERVLRSLCQVLAGWGTAAKEAVPQLLGLMEDDRTWASAATALASMGRAVGYDQEARTLLSARLGTNGTEAESTAAWAYWRVCGETGPALTVLFSAATEGRFPGRALRSLADLGARAAPYAGRLRAMTTAADPWTRVEAAHALWAVTGDCEGTVPVLGTAVLPLAEGSYLPVMLPAVRYLAQIGRASQPVARELARVPSLDQRLRCNGGWEGFAQDEDIRGAVSELLVAATSDTPEPGAIPHPL